MRVSKLQPFSLNLFFYHGIRVVCKANAEVILNRIYRSDSTNVTNDVNDELHVAFELLK